MITVDETEFPGPGTYVLRGVNRGTITHALRARGIAGTLVVGSASPAPAATTTQGGRYGY